MASPVVAAIGYSAMTLPIVTEPGSGPTPPSPAVHLHAGAWRAGRVTALVIAAGLIAGGVAAPEATLAVWWNVIVPILPASFLVSPALWRGVCPLATANELGSRRSRRAIPTPEAATALSVAGLALFTILVPARHVLFNQNGPAVSLTAVAILALAFALGVRFPIRSGFCNGICPILPVERLYGQTALVTIGRGRCDTCNVCTPRGCLDLAGDKSMAQSLGPARRNHGWMRTPFGMFALGFPGFVLGYFLMPDAAFTPAFAEWLIPLACAASSAAFGSLVIVASGATAAQAVATLAAVAVATYYWFAARSIAGAIGGGETGMLVIRLVTMALALGWLVHALRASTAAARHRTLSMHE
jgi:hypothetical protein